MPELVSGIPSEDQERAAIMSEDIRLSCRTMDLAVSKALKVVDELEQQRPKRLAAAAQIMGEVYSTAANAVLCGGPTSGQLKAVGKMVAKLEDLRS